MAYFETKEKQQHTLEGSPEVNPTQYRMHLYLDSKEHRDQEVREVEMLRQTPHVEYSQASWTLWQSSLLLNTCRLHFHTVKGKTAQTFTDQSLRFTASLNIPSFSQPYFL